MAADISNIDIVNRCIDWALEHFWDELHAVTAAPIFFAASVLITGLLIYFAFRRAYSGKLDNRDEAIRFVTASRDDFKLRLEVQDSELQRKVAHLAPQKHDPEVARQVAELKAELEKRDSRSWRGLTIDEKESFLFGIQRFEKTSIGITYNSNPDCELLASDLRDVFVNAGWSVVFLGSGTWAVMGSVGVTLLAENEAIGNWLIEVIQRTLGLSATFQVERGKQVPANLLVIGPKRLLDSQPKL